MRERTRGLSLARVPESIAAMVTVRQELERVLEESRERLRISRALRNQSRESIRRSQQAVLRSQDVITRSDRIIDDLSKPASPEEFAPANSASDPVAHLLEKVEGQCFEDQVLTMDGKHFVDCCVLNCVLEYSGQALVLETTEFRGCSFRFHGEAALTLNFLHCFGLMPERSSDVAVAASKPLRSQRPN